MKSVIKLLAVFLAVFMMVGISFADGDIDNTTGVGVVGGQGQGQGQGQSLNMDDHSVNISEAPERGFNFGADVKFGPVINYYGKPLPTAQFTPVEILLMYQEIFSREALESMTSKSDTIHELERSTDSKCEEEINYIKIIASTKQQEGHEFIGYPISEADDRKTSMIEVMAEAALDTMDNCGNVLQIFAQGAARDTETSGGGIGFHTTQATMMGGEASNLAAGGFGYSWAWAGMRDKPWIQAYALRAPVSFEPIVEPVEGSEDKLE